jgi:hypothetical protein
MYVGIDGRVDNPPARGRKDQRRRGPEGRPSWRTGGYNKGVVGWPVESHSRRLARLCNALPGNRPITFQPGRFRFRLCIPFPPSPSIALHSPECVPSGKGVLSEHTHDQAGWRRFLQH